MKKARMFPMFLVLTCTVAKSVDSGGGDQDSPTLTRRMEQTESILHRLDKTLSEQDMTMREQGRKLFSQEALLRWQGERIQQLETENAHCSGVLQRLGQKMEAFRVVFNAHVSSDNNYKSQNTRSATVDRSRRSSDSTPLSVVVDHLSQQVEEMSADIQILKTDSEALKSATDELQTDMKILQASTDKLRTDTDNLQNSNVRQDSEIRDAQTSIFTHWGSSQCTSTSDLVYSGVMGGSAYGEAGAATNFLCLTMSPVPSPVHLFAGAHLVGAEYETTDISQHNYDALCSVCRSRHPTTVTIPGTDVCTQGWQLQYSGYLMAGYFGHSAGTEFICVDSGMEGRAGSRDNHDGKLLYGTEARCGSLPCGPYANGTTVTCVVCSK